MNRKIEQWLAFIDYRDKGLVEMAKEKNEVIKEAASEYEYLTGEAAEQRLAFLREKGERDYISGMEYAENKGLERGIEKGEKNKQLEIAKKMKDKNIPTDEIIEITGLTKEEIEKL